MPSIPTAGGVSLGSSASPTQSQLALQSMDPSSYTLTNGGRSRGDSTSYTPSSGGGGGRSRGDSVSYTLGNSSVGGGQGGGGGMTVQDSRFKFQPDAALPMPRQWAGGPKRYRAGRGSSVPLDLSALC